MVKYKLLSGCTKYGNNSALKCSNGSMVGVFTSSMDKLDLIYIYTFFTLKCDSTHIKFYKQFFCKFCCTVVMIMLNHCTVYQQITDNLLKDHNFMLLHLFGLLYYG